MVVLLVLLAGVVASLPAGAQQAVANADLAAQHFITKCAGCHSVGRGAMTGPDLARVLSWPETDIATNVKRMQDRTGPLSDDEVQTLVGLLKDPNAGKRIGAEEQRALQQTAARLAPPSEAIGKQLFVGTRPLKNGGMACVSCHPIAGAGGTLGKDLAGVVGRLGQTALLSSIQQANFKVMKAAYSRHPVTAQEAAHLVKYFSTAPQTVPPQGPFLPAIFGMAGAVLFLAVMAFSYRNRNTGVRARLLRR